MGEGDTFSISDSTTYYEDDFSEGSLGEEGEKSFFCMFVELQLQMKWSDMLSHMLYSHTDAVHVDYLLTSWNICNYLITIW